MSADKEKEIEELFIQAQVATAQVLGISDDLVRAAEYEDVPCPQPSWWWRFSRSKRGAVADWHFAQHVRLEAPRELNIAENELKQARILLKQRHRLDYTYVASPHGGFRSWLSPIGSDEVVASATM